ncbi:MAG: rod shape-determining protein MreD [Chitinispirillaceae bacterium]|nr:rod shape-determining protein MreD [Chitinispirillaceae bacterium]
MIKVFFRWTGLVVLLYILQTTIVPLITVFGIKPDLLVLVLFYIGFKNDVIPAVFAGFFLGLTQDFYSPVILGQNALSKTVAGFFAGVFNEKVMRIDPIFQLILLLLIFVIHDAVFFAVEMFKTDTPIQAIGVEMVSSTLPRALYTLFFALIPAFREYFFPSGGRR